MKEGYIEKLYEPFELKERKGLGGMIFKYIPANEVIDRMNKTFGGLWSTEVASQERVDDFVVVRVRVSVYDNAEGEWFSHDGYGSSFVARYNKGDNQGQIIDLGNAYKSAEAKAIKNACTRWGVGLFMEDVADEEVGPFESPSVGSPGTTPKNIKPAATNSVNTPPPFPEKNSVPAGVSPSVPNIPPARPKPDVGKPAPKVVQEIPPAQPVQTSSVTKENGHDAGVTDVQRVAIQGLLQIKAASFGDVSENERFGKLVADALGKRDDLPRKVEDLSYQDAVTVIKYGNNIDKK